MYTLTSIHTKKNNLVRDLCNRDFAVHCFSSLSFIYCTYVDYNSFLFCKHSLLILSIISSLLFSSLIISLPFPSFLPFSGNEKRSVAPPNGHCPEGQFRCREDGTCIAGSAVCNHKYDCKQGSDELQCGQ